MTKPTENEQFDINQPFVTQEQKFKYWEESKAEIKRLQARAELADKQIAELQAQINELREALEDISKLPYTSYKWGTIAAQALSATPAQCLIQHDNEVIERCAIRGRLAQLENKVVDTEIRALKGNQNG